MSTPLAIVAGVRTPFCRLGSDFASMSADDIGRAAVVELLLRTGLDPERIDEVVFGCVAQPATAANIARVIALRSGIPDSVPALTVCRNCASGAEALLVAEQRIKLGLGRIFLVGGVESMSGMPLLFSQSAQKKFATLQRAKTTVQKLQAALAFRPHDFAPRPALLAGLKDPVCGASMGQTAETLAAEWTISRKEQDAFANRSHERAVKGRDALAEEIIPVWPTPGYAPVEQDNGPRENSSMEGLAKLKTVFDREAGTVTAGNASQMTDGAVAFLVMHPDEAESMGIAPLGLLRHGTVSGCDPARMGLGPVYAIAKAERECKLSIADADLIEINEAFAAQVLACLAAMRDPTFAKNTLNRDQPVGDVDPDQLNVLGGSIALGHPLGATGARLVLTALHSLKRLKKQRALVSACVGGGQGIALWLERP